MTLGSLDYVVLAFPGNRFKGEILPELNAIRASGIVRLVDLIFIQKDQQGQVTTTEVSDLQGEEAQRYRSLMGDISGLVTQEDLEIAANDIPLNSSAAFLLFEQTAAYPPQAGYPPQAPAPPRAAGAPTQAASAPADRLVQLKILGDLHASGVLTDQEFEREKQRILQQS